MAKRILAIDQGTTGSTALVFDADGVVRGRGYAEFTQHYPKPGWVEHDPQEIWKVTKKVVARALRAAKVRPSGIAAIGITNQRETTVVWDRKTGEPVHNAIVWQDRRTAPICDKLKADGLEATIRRKTGLVVDPYFSGTKLTWLFDNVRGLRKRAGDLAFGTIDSWLIWKLSGGEAHVTDFTNASRSLLFDIKRKRWDPQLLDALAVPAEILPEVVGVERGRGYHHALGIRRRGADCRHRRRSTGGAVRARLFRAGAGEEYLRDRVFRPDVHR